MNLNNKRIFIAPHTPRTTMFKSEIEKSFKNIHFLGYIDKVKEDKDLFKLQDVVHKEYDYILILSQNHFDAIYKEYRAILPKRKLIKVDIKNEKYLFFNHMDILRTQVHKLPESLKKMFFKKLVQYFDSRQRKSIVFLNKSFISTNNKALYTYCVQKGLEVVCLIDNQEQFDELKSRGLNVCKLYTVLSYYHLAKAKIVIQDQGNSNALLPFLSQKQKTLQMWHGIPLKRMNLLVGHIYDYFISTSKYVNDTSLSAVIQAKEYLDFGYPRNDLLLKEHDALDLLFYDKALYELSQIKKTIVYMPTHRESSSSVGSRNKNLIPIEFKKLNEKMQSLNAHFIIKFHPFVMQFYEDIKNSNEYSHIHFHSIQGDIYPLLKYTDILVTDYSSIYFDFLLLNKPIIFFDYDYDEYSSNMKGFVYDYEKCAPGEKVQTYEALELSLEKILIDEKDMFEDQRLEVRGKFFKFTDEQSSYRVVTNIINQIGT